MTAETALRVAFIYFVRGTVPKGWRQIPSIQNPPCCGRGVAVVLPGAKTSIVFSPSYMEAYTVPNDSYELNTAKWLDDLVDVDFAQVAQCIKDSWARYASCGLAKAYDVAAAVLKQLGHAAPTVRPERPAKDDGDAGPAAPKGGKPPAPVEGLRPLKRGTKRAAVAEFFLETSSIQEAMSKLSLTRSGVLSHLHCIHKYNGFGYELIGDAAARLVVPSDFPLFEDKGGVRDEGQRDCGSPGGAEGPGSD